MAGDHHLVHPAQLLITLMTYHNLTFSSGLHHICSSTRAVGRTHSNLGVKIGSRNRLAYSLDSEDGLMTYIPRQDLRAP